ncbi:MAG TPA: polysaccharide biosynthesis C-terminal domain-containing protein, partial [Longimicrobiales bacterium]|nr:polysaccharide biosynthesis C-terminal domain-containing protein [Longimicrobiales bacterium]
LFSYMVLNFDLLMVARMLGAGASGQYSIAAGMVQTLYMLPVAAGTMLFARVSEMREHRLHFLSRTVRLLAALFVPLLLAAAFLADPAVRLLYGAPFLPAVPAFLWLLPGAFFLGINTLLMNYFAGVGMPWIAVASPGVAAGANILLNLALIPRFGITGASLASSVAYGFMLAASVIYVRQRRAP